MRRSATSSAQKRLWQLIAVYIAIALVSQVGWLIYMHPVSGEGDIIVTIREGEPEVSIEYPPWEERERLPVGPDEYVELARRGFSYVVWVAKWIVFLWNPQI